MAAGPPLTSLALSASSVADDLGYVALKDLAGALGDIPAEYRVIGGHMVTVLAARWQLGASLYRQTRDVDLGVAPMVVRDQHVVGRLKGVSYVQVAGNRFARRLSDIPAGMTGEIYPHDREALIDVLVPAYTGRPARTSASGTISSPLRFLRRTGCSLAAAFPGPCGEAPLRPGWAAGEDRQLD
jgi:hypothetical protein